MNILTRLQNIDRRILYVLIAVVIILPLVKSPTAHPGVMPDVQHSFNVLNKVPKNKIVLVSTVWSASTIAENGPQTEVIMRHLFKDHTRFAVISWDQAGNEITYQMGMKIAREMHKRYGVDWVHLGYRVPYLSVVLRGIAQDFAGTLKYDKQTTPISKIPMLRGVKTYKDIGAVVEITPSPTVESWIAYFNGPYNVPLIFCPTAVMAAEAYPFLNSGQMAGMLNGVVGAAQYETLIGRGNVSTDAVRYVWALSAAHLFIIFLIIVGNVGYIAARRIENRSRGGRTSA